MPETNPIAEAVADLTLDPQQTDLFIARRLYALPDRGVELARRTILEATEPLVARYAADYLALLPDLGEEKSDIVARLTTDRPKLLVATVNLVRFLTVPRVGELASFCREHLEIEGLDSVLFEVAKFFPRLLHPHREEISDPHISRALLAGGPDAWVDDLAASHRASGDFTPLRDIGRFHTDRARATLVTAAAAAEDEVLEAIHALLESSGISPENGRPSVFSPAAMGSVVSRAEAPHAMGNDGQPRRPVCPMCQRPANRLVTLDRRRLDFDPGGAADPTFYWFDCDCDVLEFLYVRCTPDGPEGIMMEVEEAPTGSGSMPTGIALALEPHPSQDGLGISASVGGGHHQVGGYPPWIRPSRFPHCSSCSASMRWLLSLDTGVTPFGPLPGAGIFYGFWCADCSVSVTMSQLQYTHM